MCSELWAACCQGGMWRRSYRRSSSAARPRPLTRPRVCTGGGAQSGPRRSPPRTDGSSAAVVAGVALCWRRSADSSTGPAWGAPSSASTLWPNRGRPRWTRTWVAVHRRRGAAEPTVLAAAPAGRGDLLPSTPADRWRAAAGWGDLPIPMRKITTASDRKSGGGPDYYTIVSWLDGIGEPPRRAGL